MKKGILVICIISLLLIVSTIGCFEEEEKKGSDDNNDEDVNGDNQNNTGETFTAKEHYMDLNYSGNNTNVIIDYESLEDGDTLIIEDTLDNLTYDPTTNTTYLIFEFINNSITQSLNLLFDGNLTGNYQSGDKLKMTFNIKHVQFDYNGTSYDMEIYDEYWESENYFTTNLESTGIPYKPLPESVIEKS
jgi:hypothetical protein